MGELRWRRRSGSGFLTEARRKDENPKTASDARTRKDARRHLSSSPRPPLCLCASVRDLETVSRTPPAEGRRCHSPHKCLKTRFERSRLRPLPLVLAMPKASAASSRRSRLSGRGCGRSLWCWLCRRRLPQAAAAQPRITRFAAFDSANSPIASDVTQRLPLRASADAAFPRARAANTTNTTARCVV